MPLDELYEKREQSQVKHHILGKYLERFAHIVANGWGSITYVDCFAGPWNVRSPDFQDSSFAIAIKELRKARDTHRLKSRDIRLRCCFLEQDREAYRQLADYVNGVSDVEILTLNKSFEESVPDILKFIHEGGETFPFLFIDPTGWTGFALKTISPLLQLIPGEVLINFMTAHIRRFLTEEQSQQSFLDLFGSSQFRKRITDLSGVELDDAAVDEYMTSLRREARFPHVHSAIVLHPEIDRTHFHLIYATRHTRGVEVFKDTERRAMQEMERIRADAQRRRIEERTGQRMLLLGGEAPESRHYNNLRERYLAQAKEKILLLLRQGRQVAYDRAWLVALESPLVWESDLKSWIEEWQHEKLVSLQGLRERQRVPHRDSGHFLVWQGEGLSPG